MNRGKEEAYVLVIDDDEATRDALASLLGREGLRVALAADGVEALQILASDPPPELVVLELVMPRLSGWKVIEHMEDSPRLSRVPILVLTTATAREDLPRNHPALHKPFESKLLLESVTRLLRPSRASPARQPRVAVTSNLFTERTF